jgi:hypothetical protein
LQQVFAKVTGVIAKHCEREIPFFTWMLRVPAQRPRVPVEEVRTTGHRLAHAFIPEHLNDLNDALATLPSAQREALMSCFSSPACDRTR